MDKISLKSKIRSCEFPCTKNYEIYFQRYFPSFALIQGDLTMLINGTDYSMQDIEVFDFLVRMQSGLTSLLHGGETECKVYLIGASDKFCLKLLQDELQISVLAGEDTILSSKCNFLPLYRVISEEVRSLLIRIYNANPDIAKIEIPEYMYFNQIRKKWLGSVQDNEPAPNIEVILDD